MLRLLLLVVGILLLITQNFIQPFSANWQFILFLAGVFFLGIPHGAADLLVAIQSAETGKKSFSKFKFFATYLSRLIIFGLLLYFFPVFGVLLFLLFSAYHFGETDLHIFNTNSVTGKILVCSYGLVILSVILLNNMEELQLLIKSAGLNEKKYPLIDWSAENHNLILSASLLVFFVSIFLYFLKNKNSTETSDRFLLQFAFLVFILFNMPLLLGFTFYFVIWHSVLSLQNIILYLQIGIKHSLTQIVKQIIFYSALAISGIIIIGGVGFMFISNQAIMIYVFLGLAVLTAPHMPVMHDMYNKMRGVK